MQVRGSKLQSCPTASSRSSRAAPTTTSSSSRAAPTTTTSSRSSRAAPTTTTSSRAAPPPAAALPPLLPAEAAEAAAAALPPLLPAEAAGALLPAPAPPLAPQYWHQCPHHHFACCHPGCCRHHPHGFHGQNQAAEVRDEIGGEEEDKAGEPYSTLKTHILIISIITFCNHPPFEIL